MRAAVLTLFAALAADSGASGLVDVTGEVVDARLRPVADVGVFATEQGGALVRGWARSGTDGRFRMRLRAMPHDFGILSPRWLLAGFQATGETSVRVRVRSAFGAGNAEREIGAAKSFAFVMVTSRGQPAGQTAVTFGPSIGSVSGRVLDESGNALAGVLVVSVDAKRGDPLSVTLSDAKGQWELATLVGANRIAAIVPGLKLARARRPAPGTLELVLTVDAAVDHVTVGTGRTLRFNMKDSVYPAMVPPPEVRAVLRSDYQIDIDTCFCPGDLRKTVLKPIPGGPCAVPAWISCRNASECPPTVWERQCKLPKYWWLRLLRVEPPNQAKPWERWWEELFRQWQIEEFGE